jgi:zinc-binding in reverse transcriptase
VRDTSSKQLPITAQTAISTYQSQRSKDQVRFITPPPRTMQQERAAQAFSLLNFEDIEDELQWKWTTSGSYTTKSLYSMLTGSGKRLAAFAPLWRAKAPPSAKFFFFTLIQDKCLMKEVLTKRKMMHDLLCCIMCRQCPMESALHLFFLCTYAVSVWFLLQCKYQMEFIRPDLTITLVLQKGFDRTKGKPARIRSLCSRVVAATCWQLWKQRNAYIFSDTSSSSVIPPYILVERICEDVKL